MPSSIVEYVVAQEDHEDGGKHLHAFLKYEKKVQFGQNRWDLGSHHGNYQAAKSWKHVQAYVKKGGNYISNIDVESALQKRGKHNMELLNEDPLDLVASGRIDLLRLPALLKAKDAYNSLAAPLLPRATGLMENNFGLVLPVFTESTKTRHWWFWSRGPNTGKTTFLKKIASAHPSHWMARESFQTLHPQTQFILLDEFTTPYFTLFELNQMCDGTYQYPFKGGSPVMLKDPIVVICSNKPPEGVYTKQHDLIKARFSVFELKAPSRGT